MVFNNRFVSGLFAVGFIVIIAGIASAQTAKTGDFKTGGDTPEIITSVPRTMTYQGILKDNEGNPYDGVLTVEFKIYNVESGGSSLWYEPQDIEFVDGYFTVELGTINPLNLSFDEDYWLEIIIGSDILFPRQKLNMSAYSARTDTSDYAFNADLLDGMDSGDFALVNHNHDDDYVNENQPNSISSDMIIDETIQFVDIGQNGADIDQVMKWNGSGWIASDDEVGVGGGGWADDGTVVRLETDSDSVGIGTTSPSEKLEIEGNILINGKATIGSGHINTGTYATVSGGGNNTASGHYSIIGGGRLNMSKAQFSGVFSGYSNLAGDEEADTAAFVGGGSNNSAFAKYSTVSGGDSCTASGDYSTVAGGQYNTASNIGAAVSGGYLNTASGGHSVIGGGNFNVNEGNYSVIPGGYADTITTSALMSYLFGIGSKLTGDSTFMVDMPHIRFGDEATGYEFPTSDGESDQVMATDGNGQLSWVDVSSGGGGWTDDGTVVRLETIDDSVGIGTTSPTEKLDVSGNIKASGTITSGSSITIDGVNNEITSTTGTIDFDDENLVTSGKATIGPNHTNTGGNAFVAGSNNTTSGAQSTVGGGYMNTASQQACVVGGGQQNEASGSYSTVAGGLMSTASGYISTVGGGKYCKARGQYSVVSGGGGITEADSNSAIGDYSTIGGGTKNIASAYYATIAGGSGNTATSNSSTVGGGGYNNATDYAATVGGGNYNNANGYASTVGGGRSNYASGRSSTVAGGEQSTANGDYATVDGGFRNYAIGNYALAGGGSHNYARGQYSVICGGGGSSAADSNSASGTLSFIGGGSRNSATNTASAICGGANNIASGFESMVGGGYGNTASGLYSTVGAGYNNTASGAYSTVSGGYSNIASGDSSTVSGGTFNTAGGYASSVCGGHRNLNEGNNSVILGGLHDTLTSSASVSMAFGFRVYVNNSRKVVFFNDYYSGYFGLNRDDNDGGINYPIHVGTRTTNGNGAYLSYGGTWTNSSSKTFKENFQPLNRQQLLDRISQLPVGSWQYKDSQERHIGPYAEDFVSAFDVGTIREDGKRENMYLAAGDVAGVALAGVKALLERIEQLEKRIAELEAEKR